MRSATAIVGLVSPRSTWLSIWAETPLRSARSRNERFIPSRSSAHATADGALGGAHSHAAYVITDVCP